MTDLQVLFLILALLYVFECGGWHAGGSVAFVTWLGRRWRPRHPGSLLGNQQGGVLFAPPLPPLGTLLTGNQFPLSLSSDAVLGFVSSTINPGWRPRQTGRWYRFDDIRSIEATGKKVRVNGELLIKASTSTYADYLAETLRQLAQFPKAKRPEAIDALVRDGLDTAALRRRWEEFQGQTARLRLLANVLFVYLFVVAPGLIWLLGLARSWMGLVAGLLALEISTALSFRRGHKALYPRAGEERFTHFLTTLLAPASTIRARDVLSRSLLESFHPLAMARAFCSGPEFAELAGKVLLELTHPRLPLCPCADPAAQAAERDSRARWLQAVRKFLTRNGLDPVALTQPPARADHTCRAYCPRCLAQFTTRDGFCADCGGLALVAFADASRD